MDPADQPAAAFSPPPAVAVEVAASAKRPDLEFLLSRSVASSFILVLVGALIANPLIDGEGRKADGACRSFPVGRRRFILASVLVAAVSWFERLAMARSDDVLILDDFTRDDLISTLGTPWRGFSDRVMGGISRETITLTEIDGRRCLRLSGDVRLENNGGFIQMALDLAAEGLTLSALACTGVFLVARGNGETYGAHLRTPDCVRPWQSYRAEFTAGPEWQEITLPFNRFQPHRLMAPLNVRRLRRLGLVAIGRAFDADLAVSVVGLYG